MDGFIPGSVCLNRAISTLDGVSDRTRQKILIGLKMADLTLKLIKICLYYQIELQALDVRISCEVTNSPSGL